MTRLKQKLAAGEPAYGIQLTFGHPMMAEYLARLGYDAVIIEAEHGPADEDRIQLIAMACDGGGAASMLRISAQPPALERCLALGVTGIQLPHTGSAAEVAAAVAAVKYPPLGERGLGNSRSARYGAFPGGFPALMEESNQESIVMVQIEDRLGIAALPEIVCIAEVDAVLIGQVDLSSDLGVPGQVNHPEVVAATDEVIRIALGAGKAVGLSASTPDEAERALGRGARYLITSVTRSLAAAARPLLQPT